MNQIKYKIIGTILLSLSTFFVTWTSQLSSSMALWHTSLIPAPSLQSEQPEELLTSQTNPLPPEVQSAVLNDAVKRTSKTLAALKILEVQKHNWSDGCLGLGKPDEICTQAITPGWQAVVTDGVRNWTYRTDDTGNAVRLEQ